MGLTNFILECEKDNEQLRNDINYYKKQLEEHENKAKILRDELEELENENNS